MNHKISLTVIPRLSANNHEKKISFTTQFFGLLLCRLPFIRITIFVTFTLSSLPFSAELDTIFVLIQHQPQPRVTFDSHRAYDDFNYSLTHDSDLCAAAAQVAASSYLGCHAMLPLSFNCDAEKELKLCLNMKLDDDVMTSSGWKKLPTIWKWKGIWYCYIWNLNLILFFCNKRLNLEIPLILFSERAFWTEQSRKERQLIVSVSWSQHEGDFVRLKNLQSSNSEKSENSIGLSSNSARPSCVCHSKDSLLVQQHFFLW